MSQPYPICRLRALILLLSFAVPAAVSASDGFDNNYVGNDANQLFVSVDNVPHAVVFGPGQLSSGGYYLAVPNGATLELGAVHSFRLEQIISFLRSAYLDRVTTTTFYYRLYAPDGAPSPWNIAVLQPIFFLDPDSCYTTTQTHVWESSLQVNLVQGLPYGDYIFEFYVESQLYDVGEETPDPCTINASFQCNADVVHPGRFLSTRLDATDPSACNFPALQSTLRQPSRLTFTLGGTSGLSARPEPLRWSLYPNPVTGDVVFIGAAHTMLPDALQWRIFDAAGVCRGQGAGGPAVPLPGLAGGRYWLCFYDEKGKLIGRGGFVKN